MKKKLLCVLLALCFAFVCQTAFAVSFSREEYRQIVFEAIGGRERRQWQALRQPLAGHRGGARTWKGLSVYVCGCL